MNILQLHLLIILFIALKNKLHHKLHLLIMTRFFDVYSFANSTFRMCMLRKEMVAISRITHLRNESSMRIGTNYIL